MANLLVNELKPGMIIEEDKRNHLGRLLLKKDTKLTEKHIRILKIWGINEISIKKGNNNDKIELPPAWLKTIDEQFRDQPPNKTIDKIKKVLSHYYCQIRKDNSFSPIKEFKPLNLDSFNFKKEKIDMAKIQEAKTDLMTFSRIYYEILEVINNPKSSMTHLSDIVSKDPNLSMKILKVVNSSIYGLSNQVESIHKAVTLLGTKEISQLAIGITVINQFQSLNPIFLDMKKFWLHAIATAIISSLIAIELGYKKVDSFFLGGLLHDIGFLLLLKTYPETTGRAIHESLKEKISQSEAEKRLFGFNHCEVSKFIFDGINFPDIIKEMILHHHDPEKSKRKIEVRIIHCADFFSRLLLYSPYNQIHITEFSEKEIVASKIDLSGLYKIFLQANQEINETIKLFYP